VGPALGAAGLGRIAATEASLDEACPPPPVSHVIEPEPDVVQVLGARRVLFRQLYSDLKASFAGSVA